MHTIHPEQMTTRERKPLAPSYRPILPSGDRSEVNLTSLRDAAKELVCRTLQNAYTITKPKRKQHKHFFREREKQNLIKKTANRKI